MQIQWFGQSAFRLAAGDTTVFIDPLGDVGALAAERMENVVRLDQPAFDTAELPDGAPLTIVPAAP